MTQQGCPNCQQRRGKRYTADEVVLLALARLIERRGIPEQDVDAIAVEAWMIDPATFGMKGHPYPDNKRASATLTKLNTGNRSHRCRIIAPAVEIAYARHYRLTEQGRERARLLMNQAGGAGSSPTPS